ncbi:MAG: hypothetical protein K8J09_16975 [Planctomycetes bacterium]|nr:hypothetical protein [Planctomycetota bacterium]
MTTVESNVRRWCPVLGSVLALLGFAQALMSQSSVRVWGGKYFDTRALELPCLGLAAYYHRTAVLRADGQIFLQGQFDGHLLSGVVPPPPAGQSYVDVALGGTFCLGLLSNGTIVGWGTSYWPFTQYGVVTIPPLPPGLRYTRMAAGDIHVVLERSDGTLIGVCAPGSANHGQGKVPAIPAGAHVRKMLGSTSNTAVLLSDGSLLVWGDNADGQCNVPSLPPGVVYADMAVGLRHTVALRSDGQIVAFGHNFYGQCNVPPPPAGTAYRLCAAGFGHSVALRSDGVFVAWGDNYFGECDVPILPAGLVCKQLVAGFYHSAARLSDGSILTWGHQGMFESGLPALPGLPTGQALVRHVGASTNGSVAIFTLSDGTLQAFGNNDYGQTDVPSLPPGTHYVSAMAGGWHSAALRSDGQLVVWGDNSYGQCNVPALPPGTTYVKFTLGHSYTVALRSDGEVLAFGDNSFGQCSIPALPPGLVYLDIDAGLQRTGLLRSDGVILHASFPGLVQPSLPPGVAYVDVELDGMAFPVLATLRSDGSIDVWGAAAGSLVPPQPMPSGVYYVEADVGDQVVVARRSDGQVAVWDRAGPPYQYLSLVPPLDPGTSYVQVSCRGYYIGARVGPTSTYVGIQPGCAGSKQPTRLVPRDTPRIGHTLQVTLFDLPVNLAAMAMSFQQLPSPLSLTFLGMAGCSWHIPLDAIVLLSGQDNQAKFMMPIPDQPSLVGVHFFNQAVVLDPVAGNGFGAVVSDAAEGVVGDW